MTNISCKEFEARFDDFIDGSTTEMDEASAWAHIEVCSECRRLFEEAIFLEQTARSLPRSIEPQHDLWPAIAQRINEQRVVRGPFDRSSITNLRRWGRMAAAAAVLAASVIAAYMVGVTQRQPDNANRAVDGGIRLAAFSQSGTDLDRARDQLLAGLEQRRAELSPETWTVVINNLEVIDDAIMRIGAALEENPNDSTLNRRLAVAYRQQIDLLQKATRLPAEI
jgi:hypothetical protein